MLRVLVSVCIPIQRVEQKPHKQLQPMDMAATKDSDHKLKQIQTYTVTQQ